MKRKISYLLIISLLVGFSITPTFAVSNNPFEVFLNNMQSIKDNIGEVVQNLINKFHDMKNHWAVEWVAKLEGLGIISGYGDGTFRPNDNITVAEFTVLVLKAQGRTIPKTTPWYQGIVDTAIKEGLIIKGEFDNYDQRLINRGEMARIVVRAMGEKPASGSTSFKDDYKIPSDIKGFVKTATEYNIISGYTDGTFRHDGYATRAEASTIIAKMIQNAGIKPTPKPNYTEITDLPVVPFDPSQYAKYFNLEKYVRNGKLNKQAIIKKNQLPVKIDEFIIEDYHFIKHQGFDYMILQGRVTDDISVTDLRIEYIDKNNMLRKRQAMSFSKEHFDVLKSKYPDFVGLSFSDRTVKKGNTFTVAAAVDSSVDLQDDKNWASFKKEKIDKIIIYTGKNGTETILAIDEN